VQTVGKLEKTIDTKGYRRAEEEHLKMLHIFYTELRRQYPNALCLGSGGCRSVKNAHTPSLAVFRRKRFPLWKATACS